MAARHFVKLSNLANTVTRAPVDHFINPADPWQGGGRRTKSATLARGATGKLRKASSRKDALREQSSAAADAIHRDRQTRKAYAEWFASMTPEDRAAAAALGITGHVSPLTHAPARDSDPEVDFFDPSDLPAASVLANPIDLLDPQRLSVEIEALSDTEIADTAETFSGALRWALDTEQIVEMGQRLAVMVRCLRPNLAAGLPQYSHLSRTFESRVEGDHKACGAVFGRVLEWSSRGASLSALGVRLYLLAYTLRPALIGAKTLAAIGAARGNSRQATDKQAGCLRDTFAGLMARTMRGEITRLRCKQAIRGNQTS